MNGFAVEPIQDFDLHPSRKPKVLVQTAAHVAGSVEYFHRDRLKTNDHSWLKDSVRLEFCFVTCLCLT